MILAILVHQVVRGTIEIRRGRRRRRRRRRRRSPPRLLSWQETKTKKGSEKHTSPSCAGPLLSPHERVGLELGILAVSLICQSKWMLKICRATNSIFMTVDCQHCHHHKAYRYNHVALIIWAAGEAQAPKTFTHSASATWGHSSQQTWFGAFTNGPVPLVTQPARWHSKAQLASAIATTWSKQAHVPMLHLHV